MKTPIEVKDIRKGDLIRFEGEDDSGYSFKNVEYCAGYDTQGWVSEGVHYLLDRPEPPFEPYWGMVIADPNSNGKAAFMPEWEQDQYSWVVTYDGSYIEDCESDEWAKQKLAEGWVVIEKPEGVK